MNEASDSYLILKQPLLLPCGVVIKNRLAKSAMSDSLANGDGEPTTAHARLYEKWTQGDVALSVIGEIQGDSRYPERPGNLVLDADTNHEQLRLLTERGTIGGAHLWAQLGHGGALSCASISQPKGPSALKIGCFQCQGMTIDEVRALPAQFARTARLAKQAGFTGVQVHAAHGFLLSQFLSPLFNRRSDAYGGSIEARSKIIIEVIKEVRLAVGPDFPIGIKINSSDQLESGLTEDDALQVIAMLDQTSIDLIEISGGTYFPGAKSSSDSIASGPYFVGFAKRARGVTDIPLMATGGFKSRAQAIEAIANGSVDMVGLARAMVINSQLAKVWLSEEGGDPVFPRSESVPPGGITAWYTLLLTAMAEDKESSFSLDLPSAITIYDERDRQRSITWKKRYQSENIAG